MEKNKNIYNWVHLLYSRNEYIINQLYVNKIKKNFSQSATYLSNIIYKSLCQTEVLNFNVFQQCKTL